ncbi:hypothetical protein DH2020_046200 [Rehmannia glutinosa]|uniref:Bifunctional inhibitor/plant lipid transfer protein/seed storage helical domain-containing protein n=1 Tax=Rehmannia glutinosa TaxID=99300 RepID=A0ABR0UD14_REHGL
MAHYSCLYALILAIFFSIFRTNAQISTPCSSSTISTFTPCLNFVTGSTGTGSSPTESCCDSLKSLMSDNMDCVCLIVTGNVPVSIPFINASLAITLPRMCRNSVPLQCKSTGVPLPPPGPVLFGPTPAPAPARSRPQPRAPSAAAAPPPAESLDVTPAASPPKFSLGPSANPGIRPVVNPNSASTPLTISLSSLILIMHIGIMALIKFF